MRLFCVVVLGTTRDDDAGGWKIQENDGRPVSKGKKKGGGAGGKSGGSSSGGGGASKQMPAGHKAKSALRQRGEDYKEKLNERQANQTNRKNRLNRLKTIY
jgi:hypothetical protein